MMLRRLKIGSKDPLPFLKPVCSSLNTVLMALSMHLSNILQNIFLGTEHKVIPLQLSQLLRSPFFGSLSIMPCPKSLGISSCSLILWNRLIS